MIKIRKLLNPLILNDKKYVRFIGDSEFKNTDDKLIMGAWKFLAIDNDAVEDIFNLDDEIDTNALFTKDPCIVYIKNDNGDICVVEFLYSFDEYPPGSPGWYDLMLPKGVTLNQEKTQDSLGEIYFNINPDEYKSLLSQVGIMNYINLTLVNYGYDDHYSFDNGETYQTAHDIREQHGFDNAFFENKDRFVKVKKDGTYYVADKKLDTRYPIHELINGNYSDEAIDDLLEKLNSDDKKINLK